MEHDKLHHILFQILIESQWNLNSVALQTTKSHGTILIEV